MPMIQLATRWSAAAVVLGALVVTGCGGPAISSERNDAVPIPSKATVTFPASPTGGPQVNPAISNDSVHHMLRRAIAAQLQEKGYVIVADGAPANFTVRYFLAVKSTATSYAPTAGGVSGPPIQGYGRGYGRTADTPVGTVPPPEPLTNASFEVSLVDEQMGRTAWRGVLEGTPKKEAPSEARITELVAEVCKSLPQVP